MGLWQFAVVGKMSLVAGKRPGIWGLTVGEVQEAGKQIWKKTFNEI